MLQPNVLRPLVQCSALLSPHHPCLSWRRAQPPPSPQTLAAQEPKPQPKLVGPIVQREPLPMSPPTPPPPPAWALAECEGAVKRKRAARGDGVSPSQPYIQGLG